VPRAFWSGVSGLGCGSRKPASEGCRLHRALDSCANQAQDSRRPSAPVTRDRPLTCIRKPNKLISVCRRDPAQAAEGAYVRFRPTHDAATFVIQRALTTLGARRVPNRHVPWPASSYRVCCSVTVRLRVQNVLSRSVGFHIRRPPREDLHSSLNGCHWLANRHLANLGMLGREWKVRPALRLRTHHLPPVVAHNRPLRSHAVSDWPYNCTFKHPIRRGCFTTTMSLRGKPGLSCMENCHPGWARYCGRRRSRFTKC
jgi:hypothetical protein